MFLFKVDITFLIPEQGLVLTPGLGDKKAKIGDKIKLIRPDKSMVYSKICGITFNENRDILVGSNLSKEDVPIGTEVWLET